MDSNTPQPPRGPGTRLEELDKILDEYETKLGLPKYIDDENNPEVAYYLNLNKAQLEKLTIEDCALGAYLLGRFAFHLQRTNNREQARVHWAENTMKAMISGKESNYRGSWESQMFQAVKDDKVAEKLLKIKNYATQRSLRITYLSNSLKNLGDLLINVQKAKFNNG